MLRDLDPSARRALVFGLNDYSNEENGYDPDDDLRALHYAIARLRWSDVAGFAMSFHTTAAQWEALRGSILKGMVLQSFEALAQNSVSTRRRLPPRICRASAALVPNSCSA